MKLLIQNGRVVDPVNGTVSILDLYVENGKVLQLEKDIQTEADRVIAATGLSRAGGPARPSPGPGPDL